MPSIGWQELVILVLVYGVPAAALVLVVIVTNRSRRPYLSSKQTSLSVNEVLQSAVQTYSMNGYQVASHTEQDVAFTKKARPIYGFLVLMLLAGILPGIAYWVLASRNFVVNVVASTQGAGTSVNIVSSINGYGAKTTDDNFLSSLPSFVGNASATIRDSPTR